MDSGSEPKDWRVKHGLSGTKIYNTWYNMKARCYNINQPHYDRYGGRGIKVCDRWLDSFADFVSDVGLPPSDRHTLDRIENDGDYEPGNVRWATRAEQAGNRSCVVRAPGGGNGELLSVVARRHGMSYQTLKRRLARGESMTEAIGRPSRQYKKRDSHG